MQQPLRLRSRSPDPFNAQSSTPHGSYGAELVRRASRPHLLVCHAECWLNVPVSYTHLTLPTICSV
eukprot:8581540-Alexandrium_andersonii.AAC.1